MGVVNMNSRAPVVSVPAPADRWAEIYAQLRRANVPATLLLQHLRHGYRGRLRIEGGRGEAIIAGVHVKVRVEPDRHGWERHGAPTYGRLADAWAPGAIALPDDAPARWFVPANPYTELRAQGLAANRGRSDADCLARRILKIHRDRVLTYGTGWEYLVAIVTASRRGRFSVERYDGLRRQLGEPDESLETALYLIAEAQAKRLCGGQGNGRV